MVGLPVMFIFSFVLNFLKNSNIPARVAQLDECHRPVHWEVEGSIPDQNTYLGSEHVRKATYGCSFPT